MQPTARLEPTGWRKPLSGILDLLYPPVCAVCGIGLRHGDSLCDPCDVTLPRLTEPFCKSCGEPFEGKIDEAFACPNCSSLKLSFAFARPATSKDSRTLDMIHRLKYGRELHLAKELGRLAAGAFADPRLDAAVTGKWPLVPVPLHRKRHQHRHFNQAEEISRALSAHVGLPVVKALQRIRRTEHQTILTRTERMANLRGAFTVTHAGQRQLADSPAGVVLVDDVLTTGSTVNECAKTLRKAGFKNVVVVTVMRG